MDSAHRERAKRCGRIYRNQGSLPKPAADEWKPKNEGIKWPALSREKKLLPDDWKRSGFPEYPLPENLVGVVNTDVWKEKIAELKKQEEPNLGLIKIMEEVLQQLLEGASSRVGPPGNIPTKSKNVIPDPETQLPRVMDALASFVKAGHMAGPLFTIDEKAWKINQILAVPKPGGHVRVVGNLSHPPGTSFNDGIPESEKDVWPVSMLTTKQFAHMVCQAGRGAYMACSDVKDAYKLIPVCLDQRKLQGYCFCGAIFIELKMIFGDKLSCQHFDRLHFAVLNGFVYLVSPFPKCAQGRTVDDIPSVVPHNARKCLESFVAAYRATLASLDMGAAEDDPARKKAFDCAQEGEVLGVTFDTVNFTWSLSHSKLYNVVEKLRALADKGKKYSLRELQSVEGKVSFLAELCPPLKSLLADTILLMGANIRELIGEDGLVPQSLLDDRRFEVSGEVAKDLNMIAAMLVDAFEHPLPIIDPYPPIPLHAIPVYTDASGRISQPDPPCLGVYLPSYDLRHARAYSLPFPTDFLLERNGTGLVADTTTTLEAFGILIVLILATSECRDRTIHLHIDNVAVVFAFEKRRSNDPLAHCIIRAAYFLAGAINCTIRVSWIRRRSNTGARIADDLTHNNFDEAVSVDPYTIKFPKENFPHPLQVWMWKPHYDRDLGHKIWQWICSQSSTEYVS